ncbi:MAG: D-aminoacyl-tRNA deacylase [Gudongella sp.]|nr:D-aminoacyl-tRNA deacylase [Gudongella sp.]
MNKRAVFYLAADGNIDHVAAPVFKALLELNTLIETNIIVDGKPVLMKKNQAGDEFYFVRTEKVLCHDYNRYLPIMLEHFSDFDVAGIVTWHEGANAPEHIFSVHTTGDVDSGNFGPANPQFMHNILVALEKNRVEENLEDFAVTTEATHWSGMMYGDSGPELIPQYPVPIMDIEIGSSEQSWKNPQAVKVLAKSLTEIFKEDGLKLKNVLCAGGQHFERGFSAEIFDTWDSYGYGISHIIPNQWLVTGEYEKDTGQEKLEFCVNSIAGEISGIAMHDGLKGAYKEQLRILGDKYNIPVFKHQKLRKPETIEWPI